MMLLVTLPIATTFALWVLLFPVVPRWVNQTRRNSLLLVATMTTENVAAIFGDTATNSELLDVLASELDSDVAVIQLYVGSLGGPDSGAETYQEMMLVNATLIAQGLS